MDSGIYIDALGDCETFHTHIYSNTAIWKLYNNLLFSVFFTLATK